ncbi:DUF2508 family protein [Tepidibacillus marianensis]|uniref:DUF2508 family protein n=1 Tax=Tepidibacillus marianensis TaxID=3131995 RepID=UPI0030D5FD44
MMLLCYLNGLKKRNDTVKEGDQLNESQNLLKEIDKARLEWDIAIQHFNCADHPDMVEYMIYYIKAAEKNICFYLINIKPSMKPIDIVSKCKNNYDKR